MAGNHLAPPNKKRIVVIITIAVLVAALIAGGVVFFVNQGKTAPKEKPEATVFSTASQPAGTVSSKAQQQSTTEAANNNATGASKKNTNDKQASAQEQVSAPSVQDIVVPTEAEGEVTYFSNSYSPNGEAKDAESGESVPLREALGASFAEGTLTFHDDGTFTDSVITGGVSTGRYHVQNETVTAIYSDDRNMEIDVTEWENGMPAKFSVNYGGCIVYFG